MSRKLFINTLVQNEIFFSLIDNQKIVSDYFKFFKQRRKELLFCLDKFFKKHNQDLKNLKIKRIFVVNGPGSFTEIRKTLTAVNFLAHFLKIKVKGVKFEEARNLGILSLKRFEKPKGPVKPFYNQKPNITLPAS